MSLLTRLTQKDLDQSKMKSKISLLFKKKKL